MSQQFVVHPSGTLFFCLVSAHLVVIGTLFMVPVLRTAVILLFPILMASVIYYVLRDAGLLLDCSWVGLRLEEDGLVLTNRRGDNFSGGVNCSSVVTPYLVILNVRCSNYRRLHNVVLMPDSMDKESFRKLRIALRWEY